MFNRFKKTVNDWQKTSFSQCGEDLIIKLIFETLEVKKPFYIDIGAHHPFHLSNSALFYKEGANGICIEPDPVLFQNIKKERCRDVCLNIGVSGSGDLEELLFYKMSTPSLNTFSKKEAEKYRDDYGYQIENVIKVPVMPVSKVLSDYLCNKRVDLLSLDVEGMDLEILQGWNFLEHRPLVACLETLEFSNDRSGVKLTEIIDFMKSKDYMVYADTYINTIFVDSKIYKG